MSDHDQVTHTLSRIGEAWVEGVFELAGMPVEEVEQGLADLETVGTSKTYIDALREAIDEARSEGEED